MKTTFTENRQMDFGITAAAIAGGAALAGQAGSMVATGVKNKKQFRRTKELMDKQDAMNREMALFNIANQMEMWEKTGPTGQMEQLRKAGLNPGLVYGMGGAGGQTVNAAEGSAPSQGHYEMDNAGDGLGALGIQLGQQLALMNAQKENIEADTQLKKADAEKTAGVDTENVAQNTAVQRVDEKIKRLEVQFQSGTIQDRMELVNSIAGKAYAEMGSAEIQKTVDTETKRSKVKQIDQEAIGAQLRNVLTAIQSEEGKSRIKVNEQQIKTMAQAIQQKWSEIDQKNTELGIKAFEAEIKANYPGLNQVLGREINEGLRDLWEIVKTPRTKVETIK